MAIFLGFEQRALTSIALLSILQSKIKKKNLWKTKMVSHYGGGLVTRANYEKYQFQLA